MIIQSGALLANDDVIHEVFAGILLAVIGGGLKMWKDQSSDQRAWRHDKANRTLADQQVMDRFERLETKTDVAVRLEVEVQSLAATCERIDKAGEDLRKMGQENSAMLSRLLGRAEQADADFSRRRRTDG